MSCEKEDCYYQDEITGACTNDAEECVEANQYVKTLGPDDMFKTLFMLIYNLGGEVEVSAKDLAIEDEIKIEHEYDPKKKKYIMTCNPQPPAPTLVKAPKGLRRPRKKLFIPGRN